MTTKRKRAAHEPCGETVNLLNVIVNCRTDNDVGDALVDTVKPVKQQQ